MPDFLALQIEPSTHCPLTCPTCPRTAFSGHWKNTHFPMEQLDRILPLAARSELVLLQGWGEPLCHPRIAEMVRRIRRTGAQCTLTTNGVLLDEARGRALLEAGLTHLTLSISGARPQTHARLRPPSDLAVLMARIRRFRQTALAMKNPVRLTLSFLQQSTNIHETPEVIALARDHGLDHCLIINASYAPTPDHAAQCPRPGVRERWAAWRTLLAAIRHSMPCTQAELRPAERAVCANDPLRCFTVGADGSLSPCIFLQLPLKDSAPAHAPTAVMGNLFHEDFETLWNADPWRDFRAAFEQRQRFCDAVYADIDPTPQGRRRLLEAPARIAGFFMKNPPPPPCRNCAKMMGL